MKSVREQIALISATCLLVFCVAVVPAAAEDGSGSTTTGLSSPPSSTTVQGTPTSGETPSGGGKGEPNSGVSGDNTDQGGNLKGQATALLNKDRKSGHVHTQAQRQQACVANKNGINHKMSNLSTHANRFLDSFNKIFTQVQSYQSSKQLNVSNYDALVADVTAKQATATSAVAALKSVSGSIDCSASDPATAVASVKTAADAAKTALQSYRTSLKALVQALLAAKNTTANSSASSTSNSSDSTGTTGASTGGN